MEFKQLTISSETLTWLLSFYSHLKIINKQTQIMALKGIHQLIEQSVDLARVWHTWAHFKLESRDEMLMILYVNVFRELWNAGESSAWLLTSLDVLQSVNILGLDSVSVCGRVERENY